MSLTKKAMAEFLGTFWLVFGGCGSAVLAAGFPGLGIAFAGVALAFGLTVLTMAYAIGHISGCHLNPAVSIGLAMARRFPATDLLPYIIAQVAGAIAAAAVLLVIASGKAGFDPSAGFASNGYGAHSPGGYSLAACVVAEIVLTFMFLIIILGATDRRAPQGFAPIAIGLGLTLIHLISIPVTNTSVNPARSTGPAIFAGGWAAAAAVALLVSSYRWRCPRWPHLQDTPRRIRGSRRSCRSETLRNLMRIRCIALAFCLCVSLTLFAQTPPVSPKPEPDVLLLIDGEKLIGHLQRATSSSVVFKSDLAGEVTVEWSKVQELRSAQKFAAIPKTVKLRLSEDASQVPQGSITATAQKIEIAPSPDASPKTVAVGDLAQLVPQPNFERAFHRSGLTQGWAGGATAGLSLTEATQKNQAFTAAVNLVRSVPGESWLDQRSRTVFDYSEAYSKLTQPGSPSLKTSLFHADLEQDFYFSPRLFVFGRAMFDHSVSQGLDLQQTYGGGLGIVVLKSDTQEFDVKASADYVNQRFATSALNKKLFGSIFGETFLRKFAHGVLLNEQGGFNPAWNNTSAYSAFASAGLTFPVYHHLGLTLGALDNFLNDPPPGFKKNSFQLTVGATYSFPPSP